MSEVDELLDQIKAIERLSDEAWHAPYQHTLNPLERLRHYQACQVRGHEKLPFTNSESKWSRCRFCETEYRVVVEEKDAPRLKDISAGDRQ